MQNVYEELRRTLLNARGPLRIQDQSDSSIRLETGSEIDGKGGEFFASVEIKKNYVSFHLMPVYCFPELAAKISPELKKRMQGKSCFNFKRIETGLFDELGKLINQGIESYREDGRL